METGPRFEFAAAAWFERQLATDVSCLALLADDALVAGDWDGDLLCWSTEGEPRWSTKLPDRVSAIVEGEDMLIVACGRDIACVDSTTGEVRWTAELEGSSDHIALNAEQELIVATSSVYDIELNDFLESTIWRLDLSGNLLRRDSIDERPWSLVLREDGVAEMALGRPRCGLLKADADGTRWVPLPDDSPATCGINGRLRTVIGHANGAISCIEDGFILDDSPYLPQSGPIEDMACISSGLLVAVAADGVTPSRARAYLREGAQLWELDAPRGVAVERVLDGPGAAWIGTWSGTASMLILMDADDGSPLGHAERDARITALAANERFAAVGFGDGHLFLFEAELLMRRIGTEEAPVDDHRVAMRERLRGLR